MGNEPFESAGVDVSAGGDELLDRRIHHRLPLSTFLQQACKAFARRLHPLGVMITGSEGQSQTAAPIEQRTGAPRHRKFAGENVSSRVTSMIVQEGGP